MSLRLKTEDLELVEAIHRHGSVGAAAKELLTTQPSASRRLAMLERRLGLVLFDRDTTGARATAAGLELARRACRLLRDLDALPEALMVQSRAQLLSLGTIQALAPIVFTAAQLELPKIQVQGDVDHGPVLIEKVGAGSLDAAIISIAEQTALPSGVQAVLLGISPLVLVVPEGTGFGAERNTLSGHDVLYSAIDLAGARVHTGLASLGAHPRPGLTIEATLRIARESKVAALVPELAAHWWSDPHDNVLPSPIGGRVALHLVTRTPGPTHLLHALPAIAARILDGDSPL